MENVKKNITIFASLFILLILLTSGCAKKAISLKQGPIRYQDIEIPGYSKGDYEKLLTSKDYEVRYNARTYKFSAEREGRVFRCRSTRAPQDSLGCTKEIQESNIG